MTRLNIDPKKLLGFRILDDADIGSLASDAKAGAKIGDKGGTKIGLKEGGKGLPPA